MGAAPSVKSDEMMSKNANSLENKIAILCHSSRMNEDSASQLKIPFITELSDVYSADFVSSVENLDTVVVILDYNSQRSSTFLALLSFVKNCHKKIIATKFDDYYQPTGGVAAICKAYGLWYGSVSSLIQALSFDYYLDSVQKVFCEESKPHLMTTPTPAAYDQDVCISFAPGSEVSTSLAGVMTGLISFCAKSILVSDSNEDALTSIERSRVVLFIITAETASSKEQMAHIRRATQLEKYVLPIKSSDTNLTGWVALTMAGKIYHEIDLQHTENLNKKFIGIPNSMVVMHDSTPAMEITRSLRNMIKLSTKPRHAESEVQQEVVRRAKQSAIDSGVERADVDTIMQNVKDTRSMSSKTSGATTGNIAFPGVSEVLPPVQELQMANIHYTITRMSLPDPIDTRDEYDLPIEGLQLDTMISYEWHSQRTVLDLHQQFTSSRAWLDVLGNMQGNMNTAMAQAVESVACILVFVSEKYQNSINCRLELTYAVACNKPLIFVLLEGREAVIQPWLKEIMGDYDVYPLPKGTTAQHPSKYVVLDYSCEFLHGIPMANAITGIVLKYVAWRALLPPTACSDSSREVFDITSQLVDAQLENSNLKTTTCTRCSIKYNPRAPYDGKCRKHRAYYVGGNIMAGRWVCCSTVEKNGMGCEVASCHIAEPRTWYCDQSYGTYTWKPE